MMGVWQRLIMYTLLLYQSWQGRIRFEDNERSGRLTVKQIVGAHEVPVAEYESASKFSFAQSCSIKWFLFFKKEKNRFFLTRWYSVSQRVSNFMDVGDWTAQRPNYKNRWGIKNEHPGLRNIDQCCSPRYRFGFFIFGRQSQIQESKVHLKKKSII